MVYSNSKNSGFLSAAILLATYCGFVQSKDGQETKKLQSSLVRALASSNKNKTVEKVSSPEKGFFSFGGSYISDIFEQSLESKVSALRSEAEKQKAFAEVLEPLSVTFGITQDFSSINSTGVKPFKSFGEPKGTVNFKIDFDLGKHIMSIPVYILKSQAIDAKEMVDQNKLCHDIALALFEYLINKAKLKITRDGLNAFKEHVEGARARFKTGVINQIGLTQAEHNYAQMQSRYATALVKLQSSKEALLKFGQNIDLSKIDKCDFSFEKLDLDPYIAGIIDNLHVKKAKADLQHTRASALANNASAILPNLVIENKDLFAPTTLDPNGNPIGGRFTVGLVFSLSPKNLTQFSQGVTANKIAVLELVNAKRTSTISMQNLLGEFRLQKENVKIHRTSANLRASIASLYRAQDIKDPVSHYDKILKADYDMYKSYEDLQDQIFLLIKTGLKLMETAGLLVPSNLSEVSKVITQNNKQTMKAIEKEAQNIVDNKPVIAPVASEKKSVKMSISKTEGKQKSVVSKSKR